MRKLTPVTTSIMTSDSASRRKATAGTKSSIRTQVHNVCVKTRASGGSAEKRAAIRKAIAADMAMEPAPTIATPVRRSRAPDTMSTRKPANGTAGTSHSRSSTSASQHRGGVGVQGAETVVELDDECETDGDLGGGHRQDEQKHDLPIHLAPPGAGHHKRQPRRVQHHFDRHQDEDDVASHQHPEQPEAEQR